MFMANFPIPIQSLFQKSLTVDKTRQKRRVFLALATLLFAAIMVTGISGCGGGAGESRIITPLITRTGTFVDDPVDGVDYSTQTVTGAITHAGVTENGGQYQYEPGDWVTFAIGNVQLGHATLAKPTLTPIDLVTNGSIDTAEVVNIATFLQSLNSGVHSSRITIPDGVRKKLRDLPKEDTSIQALDFTNDPSSFISSLGNLTAKVVTTQDYLETGGTPIQVTPDQAKKRLQENLVKLGSLSVDEIQPEPVEQSYVVQNTDALKVFADQTERPEQSSTTIIRLKQSNALRMIDEQKKMRMLSEKLANLTNPAEQMQNMVLRRQQQIAAHKSQAAFLEMAERQAMTRRP